MWKTCSFPPVTGATSSHVRQPLIIYIYLLIWRVLTLLKAPSLSFTELLMVWKHHFVRSDSDLSLSGAPKGSGPAAVCWWVELHTWREAHSVRTSGNDEEGLWRWNVWAVFSSSVTTWTWIVFGHVCLEPPNSWFQTKFSIWLPCCSFCVGLRKWWHHPLKSLRPIVPWSHEHVPETTRPTIRLCLVGPAGPSAKNVQNQQQLGGGAAFEVTTWGWLQSEDHLYILVQLCLVS